MAESFLQTLFGFDRQVAVVIGATGVLCGAMAEGLAQAGATVVVAGRDEGRGAERVAAIEAKGGQAAFLPVDVMSRESIAGLLAATVARFGRVDALNNVAGVKNASNYYEA